MVVCFVLLMSDSRAPVVRAARFSDFNRRHETWIFEGIEQPAVPKVKFTITLHLHCTLEVKPTERDWKLNKKLIVMALILRSQYANKLGDKIRFRYRRCECFDWIGHKRMIHLRRKEFRSATNEQTSIKHSCAKFMNIQSHVDTFR